MESIAFYFMLFKTLEHNYDQAIYVAIIFFLSWAIRRNFL